MLRMYLLQSWFNLSDEGIEDAVYDSYAFRKFMGIDFNNEQVPDATTLLKFRHLLEKNHIGESFFDAIKKCLDEAVVMMSCLFTVSDLCFIYPEDSISSLLYSIPLLSSISLRIAILFSML